MRRLAFLLCLMIVALAVPGCGGLETVSSTTANEAVTTTSGAVVVGSETAPLINTNMVGPTVIDVLYAEASLVVTPQDGGVTDVEGLALAVPPGAVAADTTIEIKRLESHFGLTDEETASTVKSEDDLVGYVIGPAYDLGPEGLSFDQPVTVTLPYDEELIPLDLSEDTIAPAYWNGEAWVATPGEVDKVNNTVTVRVDRFDGLLLEITLGSIIVGSGIVIYHKLTDPERISTDALMKGTANQWVTPREPAVAEKAKVAVLQHPDSKDSVPLSDPAAVQAFLEKHASSPPHIVFPGQNPGGGDITPKGRYSKAGYTNWQKPVDYLTKNEMRGDCTDVTNAMMSILINQGYKAKGVFGYAGDKNSPHVWVELVVDGKPYFVDENGQFAPLTDAELEKAGLIRPDPSDPRNLMWDDKGQAPYTTGWWQNSFAGIYKGTIPGVIVVVGGGKKADAPWGFLVDKAGAVTGGWDYEWTGHMVQTTLTFTGQVSDTGQLTASGVEVFTSKSSGQTQSGKVSLKGEISGTTFTGSMTGDAGASFQVTATRQ